MKANIKFDENQPSQFILELIPDNEEERKYVLHLSNITAEIMLNPYKDSNTKPLRGLFYFYFVILNTFAYTQCKLCEGSPHRFFCVVSRFFVSASLTGLHSE